MNVAGRAPFQCGIDGVDELHVAAGFDVGGEVDALLAQERLDLGALAVEIAGDQQHPQAARGIGGAQPQQVRELLAAGHAPGRPDVDHAWPRRRGRGQRRAPRRRRTIARERRRPPATAIRPVADGSAAINLHARGSPPLETSMTPPHSPSDISVLSSLSSSVLRVWEFA